MLPLPLRAWTSPPTVAMLFVLHFFACSTCHPLNSHSSVYFGDSNGTDHISKRAVRGEEWECEISFETYNEDCPNGAEGLSPCQPGQLKIRECIGADGDKSHICEPCPKKFFQSSYNRCTSCHECTECGANERIKVHCTDETDTVCESIIDPGSTPEASNPPSTTAHEQTSLPHTTTSRSTTHDTSAMTTDIASSDGSQRPPEKTDVGTGNVTNTSGANIPVASKRADSNITAVSGWLVAGFLLLVLICTCLHYNRRCESGRRCTRNDTCTEKGVVHNSDSGEDPSHPQTSSRCTENGDARESLPDQTQMLVSSPMDDVQNYNNDQKLSISKFGAAHGAKKCETITKGRGTQENVEMTNMKPELNGTRGDSHKCIDTEIVNDAGNHKKTTRPTSGHTTYADVHSVSSQSSTCETDAANSQPLNAGNGLEQQGSRGNCSAVETPDQGEELQPIENDVGDVQTDSPSSAQRTLRSPESPRTLSSGISTAVELTCVENGNGQGEPTVIDHSRPAGPAHSNLLQPKDCVVITKLETGSRDGLKPADPRHRANPLLPNGTTPEVMPTQIGATEESKSKSKLGAYLFELVRPKRKRKKCADRPEEPKQSEPLLSSSGTMVSEHALEHVAEKIPLKTRDKLCRCLGLTATEVENLKFELGQLYSGSELVFHMFLDIRKKQGQKFTYSNLIVALRASKNSDLADDLTSRFNVHHS